MVSFVYQSSGNYSNHSYNSNSSSLKGSNKHYHSLPPSNKHYHSLKGEAINSFSVLEHILKLVNQQIMKGISSSSFWDNTINKAKI